MRRRTVEAGERGAVTVEFILTAGLLFIILFSVIEFAFIFNAKLIMTGAAREGARRAAVEGGATPGAYACIEEHLALGNIAAEAVEITITPNQASYGTMIRVRLVYDYPVMTALLRPIVGRRLTLTAEVISRGEKVRER
jgi:Flp pilus assembly protein TadG